jgi:hypothetical protein
MNAPFQTAGNYANLINAINAPTTATEQAQLSPLQAISALAGAPKAACSLLSSLGQTNLLSSLKNMAGAIVSPLAGDVTQPGLDNSLTFPAQSTNPSAPGYFDPSANGYNGPCGASAGS